MFSRHWTSVSLLESCEPLARVDTSETTVQVRIDRVGTAVSITTHVRISDII